MTKRFWLAVACFAWGVGAVGNAGAAELRAGVAVRIVTPNPLLPVSGGVGVPDPVQRKDGELTVRALVLASGETKVAIVSTDFLGFPAVLGDRARARVKGIAPENILIAATHTHSAPDPYAFADEQGRTGADLKYLGTVADRVAEVIQEAADRLVPAEVRIAAGEAKGKIAYNAYAEALFDPTCAVIQVREPGGKAIATLVNYAVHPEVFGSRSGTCSPDLVGPLYDRLAEKGAGVGIFINGAQGGMVTADNRGPDGRDVGTWAECVRIGNRLADEALRIVEHAPAEPEPRLACHARRVKFPVESPILRAVLGASPMGYKTDEQGRVETQVNLVQFGSARILTIPGEALPNVGAYLKRHLGGKPSVLFGLTNDAFGYILSKEDWSAFPRYGYISRTSPGERTAEILEAAAADLVAVAGH